jgi:hypothetical protein
MSYPHHHHDMRLCPLPHLNLGCPLLPADGTQPLVLTYADLDPSVQYRVRVVYSYQGWSAYPLQSLWAVGADNTTAMLHGDQVPLSPPTLFPFLSCSITRNLQPAPQPLGPQEWDVPKKITATGQVSIRCVQSVNNGGSSRGCLISEVNDIQRRACLRCVGFYCVLLLRQSPPSVVSPVLSSRFCYRFGSFQ